MLQKREGQKRKEDEEAEQRERFKRRMEVRWCICQEGGSAALMSKAYAQRLCGTDSRRDSRRDLVVVRDLGGVVCL